MVVMKKQQIVLLKNVSIDHMQEFMVSLSMTFSSTLSFMLGTLYGHGVYFATNAKYSDPYARLNQANERCMFVVSVLIGRSIRGDSSMKVPPTGYDSTTDNNQIFVVYHDAQAYADYLIKYQ